MAIPSRYTEELYRRYRRDGYWTDALIADYWDRNASLYPDKEAIVDSHTRLTWAQARTWIDRTALGFLKLGLKKDEVAVSQLPNSVELTLLRVACEKAGILCLPVLRTFRHSEMAHILKTSQAVAIVILKEFRGMDYPAMVREIRPGAPSLRHVVFGGEDVPPGSPSLRDMVSRPLEKEFPPDFLQKTKTPWNEFSLACSTSGTTGIPKLAEFPVCCNVYQGKVAVERLHLTPDDTVFSMSPAALGPSMVPHLGAPMGGCRIVMQEHFTAQEALEVIQREKVTVLAGVPAQLAMLSAVLASTGYDTSSLRVIRVTGSPLPYQVGKEAEEKLGAPVTQAYGAVDFGHLCDSGPEDTQETRLLTVGRLQVGNELKLVDDSGPEVPPGEVGEVCARGPGAISGYFRDPEATRATWQDGWYHMGDLGKLDSHGILMVVGRKKDMIIRGGQNIYPTEIESLLVTHPAVSAVTVVAMPDRVMGEKACAYIVPKQGRSITFAEMVDFLKGKDIAPFKLPERLEIVESLPMVADGQKIDKKLLAARIADKTKAEETS
ncbi:MAG: AMP-binding protein [Chloroflexi bacterium]|nr:AMP-binding protein [Chloroflexota bacterium]